MSKYGWVALAFFMLTIPLANWTLDHYGFWDTPIGPVASGVVWIGAAFVMRDIAQRLLGKWLVWVGILGGGILSWWLSSPKLATASMVSFLVSEGLDWAIYTPLADRHFIKAVALSSWVGAFLDSALFVQLAFHSYTGWWQLAVGKSLIIAACMPVVYPLRQRPPATT